MSLDTVFNTLGQTVIPQIGAAVFPDTLTVQGETAVSDSGGGYYLSATGSVHTAVPCVYEPLSGSRVDSAGKLVSIEAYTVTMPTHHGGSRINLDPKVHRLVVAARGNEPVKTFRIVSIGDDMGVVFEVVCEREN